MRGFLAVSVCGLASCLLLAASVSSSLAQSSNRPETDGGRFMLVESGDEFLRLDRENGRVAQCRKRADTWQCVPVPDAQMALETEIARLSTEVARLREENETLSSTLKDLNGDASEVGNGNDTPGESDTTQAPDAETAPQFTPQEEAEFDKAMDFTERAMRRFFGMMKTLRDEYDTLGQ